MAALEIQIHLKEITGADFAIVKENATTGKYPILVGESGRGYYQIWGEEPKEILPGTVVTIPEGTKHWHGAGPNNMMQHLSVMLTGEGVSTEWMEPVDPAEYAKLK